VTDVLVVGGGPAGAAAGFWLADAGCEVTVVERKHFPREKTCGDGLTPRATRQLDDMGLLGQLEADHHRCAGLRVIAHGRTLEMPWPAHPDFPPYGFVIRRRVLDALVAERAEKAGATFWTGAEAVAPLLRDGRLMGAVVERRDPDGGVIGRGEVRAKYVVIADGALSRFGRALGMARNRSYPQGMAIRGYFESPMHDDPWLESALDLRDRNGNALPGYGWIFPVGDGTVNVGVGLLSTFRDFKSVNTSWLQDEWVRQIPEHWQIDPSVSCGPPVGGRLPMGGSVNPKSGPNWLVVGDAAGTVNPFNGEGIDYAYETGRLAAGCIARALASGSALHLQAYERALAEEYGLYFKVARLFAQVIGRPALMAQLTRIGMRSQTLMEWVLRIMANLLRPDEIAPAEAAYRAAAAAVRLVPERWT
jgi:geranylgeranyl reductase family protein